MGYGNKGPHVWRQKYERHKVACLKRSVKHPASVMVWGCMSSRGVGSLCFLSPKTTVNTEVYIDLLDAYLLPSVDKLFADDDFVFQHDLAPAHRSYKTAKYLKEKNWRLGMAMQLTWPQHHWICLAEDEDSSVAGPPKNSGGVKGNVTWGLGLLHAEWAGRDGGIYAKENSRGNREERRCNEVLALYLR